MNSPFVFDCSALLRGSGMPEHVTNTGPCPERIGLPMIAIEPGTEVTVDATLTSLGSGIMVDALVSAELTGQCSRCLTELHPIQEFHIHEVFSASDSFIQGEESDEDDVPVIVDDQLDLLQSVVDVAGLELPFNPTCEGGCEEGDVPTPDGIAGEENDLPDPRWAGLEKFL
ncbi:MAG: YceD family protein [Corynebacterium sp.]|nr:YceD family protein [Corynebacterium sp.]